MAGQRRSASCFACLVALCVLLLVPARGIAQPTVGACCLPSGVCGQLNSCECAAQGGEFVGAGTPCAVGGCAGIVFGACCSPSGCIFSSVSNCANIGSTPFPNQTCVQANCPVSIPPEACCCTNPSVALCTMMSAFFCNRVGGVTQGPGSTCSPTPCPQPPAQGACCDPSTGACQPTNGAGACPQGYVFQGAGTVCVPSPCLFAFCCNPATGFCAAVINGFHPPGCFGPGGYKFVTTNPNGCSPTPCPPTVTGLICCDPCTGSCALGTINGCPVGWASLSGSTCTPNPCPPGNCPMVCCIANGGCVPVQAGSVCQGTPISGTSSCAPVNPCQTHGCCDPSTGNCVNLAPCPAGWTQVATCTPNPCMPAQVCCDLFGNCAPPMVGATCIGQLVFAATCTPNPCVLPPSGACCQTCGQGCSIVAQALCPNPSLFFPGLACSPALCPQTTLTGACCLGVNCGSAVSSCDCIRKGGTWLGATACTPAACAATVSGACCNSASLICGITTQSTCQAVGFSFSANLPCSAAFPACSAPAPACCCCGACTDLEPALCALAGGTSQAGVTCAASQFVCNPNGGACCDPANGQCTLVTSAGACVSITSAPGLFYLNQSCGQIPQCGPSGVCCDLFTGFCVATPISQCSGPFFQFFANGTCNPSPCVPTAGPCCQLNAAGLLVCVPVPNASACSGTFMGVGANCSQVNCNPPLAVCCNTGTGMCLSTSAPCPNGYTTSTAASCVPNNPCPPVGACCQFASCFVTTQLLCGGGLGTSWAQGGSCTPTSPCVAACCNLQTGGCAPILTAAQACPAGTQQFVGQSCGPNPCPQPPVVCCNVTTGACSTTTTNCPAGTSPLAGASGCAPTNPCPPIGPCCFSIIFCFPATSAVCASIAGVWGPANGSCGPSTCSGACCLGGTCTVTPQASCASPSLWVSGGTCAPANSCPGACCIASTATCQQLSQAQCQLPNFFLGAGTPCQSLMCTPGACCNLGTGLCSVVASAAVCSSQFGANGLYLGVGSACPVTKCGTGGCCLPNGQCVITTKSKCTAGNKPGYWLGLGTACTPLSCSGRCCTSGGCTVLNPLACVSVGGTWGGSGTHCKGGGLGCLGACCSFNGSCAVTLASQCAGFGSQWLGGATTCTPTNPCLSGACCKPPNASGLGTMCLTTNFIGCFAQSGQWQGYGVACQTPAGSGNHTACCKANWNSTSGVDILDIFSFLSCWFCAPCWNQPGSPCYGKSPDFDGDNVVTILDIFAFLNAWFGGCS